MNDKSLNLDNKMVFHGIGPKITLLIIPFFIIFGVISVLLNPFSQIPIPQIWMVFIGLSLLLIGFYIYLTSIIAIKKAYDESRFLTTGFYGHMRHPVYSSFILFITPGIVCFFNSWILFIVPPIFYIIYRICIKKEESSCLAQFGEKYAHYKTNVYGIIPKLKKYSQTE